MASRETWAMHDRAGGPRGASVLIHPCSVRMRSSPANPILLVEDNDIHAAFFTVALRRHPELHLSRVRDGLEAQDYLLGVGKYANRSVHPLPVAMIVDLLMPRCDGAALLTWMRARPDCAHVPAVMVSSSIFQEDMDRSYAAGAQAFFVKPSTPMGFQHLLDCLLKYWTDSGLLSLPTVPAAEAGAGPASATRGARGGTRAR